MACLTSATTFLPSVHNLPINACPALFSRIKPTLSYLVFPLHPCNFTLATHYLIQACLGQLLNIICEASFNFQYCSVFIFQTSKIRFQRPKSESHSHCDCNPLDLFSYYKSCQQSCQQKLVGLADGHSDPIYHKVFLKILLSCPKGTCEQQLNSAGKNHKMSIEYSISNQYGQSIRSSSSSSSSSISSTHTMLSIF